MYLYRVVERVPRTTGPCSCSWSKAQTTVPSFRRATSSTLSSFVLVSDGRKLVILYNYTHHVIATPITSHGGTMAEHGSPERRRRVSGIYRRGSTMSEWVTRQKASCSRRQQRLTGRAGQASWKMSRWHKMRYSNSAPCPWLPHSRRAHNNLPVPMQS